MGKNKTAQRAARATGITPPPPPKPKLHAWFKNPAYHGFMGTNVCTHCNKPKDLHRKVGEDFGAYRLRLRNEEKKVEEKLVENG